MSRRIINLFNERCANAKQSEMDECAREYVAGLSRYGERAARMLRSDLKEAQSDISALVDFKGIYFPPEPQEKEQQPNMPFGLKPIADAVCKDCERLQKEISESIGLPYISMEERNKAKEIAETEQRIKAFIYFVRAIEDEAGICGISLTKLKMPRTGAQRGGTEPLTLPSGTNIQEHREKPTEQPGQPHGTEQQGDKGKQENSKDDETLANILTEEVKAAFGAAIKAKYMEQTADGYKWVFGEKRGKVRLAYFLQCVFNPDECRVVPYKQLEKLFSVKHLAQSLNQKANAKNTPKWEDKINELFKRPE